MRKVGVLCIIVGFLCLMASGGWVVYNRLEAKSAETAASVLLQDVHEQIAVSAEEQSAEAQSAEEPLSQQALTTQVSEYECVGILSIPALGLELPVLADWSYEKLKIAPCVYYGTYQEKNFVIAAHNYEGHFKRLSQLQEKDLIFFTDVSGGEHIYEVVLLETLPGDATEEMITAGFDLSLYTCTPGGASRVTVRCTEVSAGNNT
ncbi:MAG: sortase [Oscillospiraceae bacterium]|nr:sortase [Oscillospiraceae bacterium]